MRRPTLRLSGLAFATILVAACARDLPTKATPGDPAAAVGGNRDPLYTSIDLGALLGNYSSRANGVNDAGDVVGSTCCGLGSGAFAVVAGVPTVLPGDGGDALAISNGNPRYVVGWVGAPSTPVRWSITEGQPSQPTNLALLAPEGFGAALGLNDAGDAVGRAGNSAAVWSVGGERTSVPPPEGQGFVRGEGRDINNAGHAVFVFFTAAGLARGHLRLASGQLVELAPLGTDVTSFANGLSEVANDALYVAGTTRTSQGVSRAVRWRVNVTTGQILSTEVRSENSHALAVSNAGGAAGFLEGRSLKFSAFIWRGSEFLLLRPPTSGKNARAWALSASGEFVAGEAFFGVTRHAVRWTILTP